MGTTQWEFPQLGVPQAYPAPAPPRTGSQLAKESASVQEISKNGPKPANDAKPTKPPQQLPPGWVSQVDPSSGNTFYANTATGHVQWMPPQVQTPRPTLPTFGGNGSVTHHHALCAVSCWFQVTRERHGYHRHVHRQGYGFALFTCADMCMEIHFDNSGNNGCSSTRLCSTSDSDGCCSNWRADYSGRP